MTIADKLNVAGFVVAGLGSSVGMLGVFKQTNAYYPFKVKQFLEHLFRVVRKYATEGRAGALQQIYATVKLSEERGEDRTQSLIGLYYVLFGFFLQLFGAFLLFLGSLLASGGTAK